MTEKFNLFLKGPLSQWYRCSFVKDGIKFSSTEQWMMYQKAKLFGHDETAQKILEVEHPKDQKALGRQVKGFNVVVWQQHCQDIVYQGNLLKFTQNKDLQTILLDTEGTTLVECNTEDLIWSCGLSLDDPNAHNRKLWKGKNLLGEILTKLRDNLIADKKNQKLNN